MADNPATSSTPKLDEVGEGRWMSMHNRFVEEAKEKEPDVVFLGDSLFANLGVTEIWDKMFAPLHCLNFGIGRDETQNLLWRLENGELDNINPKVLVIQVGTNNCVNVLEPQTSMQVYEGIRAVVHACHRKQPEAQVIVMTIPPRGQFHNPIREKVAAVNHLLATRLPADCTPANASFTNPKTSSDTTPTTSICKVQVLQLDPGLFLNPNDGTISHHDMFDYLHFTRAGYTKFSEPVLEELQTLLKEDEDVSGVTAATAASSV